MNYHRPILTLLIIFCFVLNACGGRSPHSRAQHSVSNEILGPNGNSELTSASDLSALMEEQISQVDAEGIRGCGSDEFEKYTSQAQKWMKSNQLDLAFDNLQKAWICSKNEDMLLLMAAVRDKQLQNQFGTQALSDQNCADLLLKWSSYLTYCNRCKDQAKVTQRNRAIKRANMLGKQCGAWLSWKTEPSNARIFVENQEFGLSPFDLWLPKGQLSFVAQYANRKHEGQINLTTGEEISILSQLTKTVDQKYQISAELVCDRPSLQEPLKQCTGSLVAGDRFRVKVSAGEEPVHLYVLSMNEKNTELIFPSKKAVKLKSKTSTFIPSEDAYQLDDQSKSDAIIVMTSREQVELFLNHLDASENDENLDRQLRNLLKSAKVAQGDQSSDQSDEQGWVMIKWDLRPKVKIPLKSGDQS